MSDSTTTEPVWWNNSDGTANQIGTATPGDEEGTWVLDIWPAYATRTTERVTVGKQVFVEPGSEPVAEEAPKETTTEISGEPQPVLAGDTDPANDNNTNAEPAEGALAKPVQPVTRRDK